MTVTTTDKGGEAEDHDNRRDASGEVGGRNPAGNPAGASSSPPEGNSLIDETTKLIEQMIERENLNAAWRRVRSNKGAAGVDSRGFDQTEAMIREHWTEIREHLLRGTYVPKAVKRVEIPKPGGGKRKLGGADDIGSMDPAGSPASVNPDLRAGIFPAQLRVPTRTQRP